MGFGFLLGQTVPRTGTVCSPMTAAEPYMYVLSSSCVAYERTERSLRIEARKALKLSGGMS